MQSPDLVGRNIDLIAALFPHCVTETTVETHGRNSDGVTPSHPVTRKIDFDLLRQELSRDIVEGPKERYRLEWPGKREAIVTANMPTTHTLRPVREDSVNFDTTENLYLEGDNLEVLKLLQESYLGKIKMIYIDPPYNTGNDFVYKDNFAQDTEEYKQESGLVDEQGNRLVANPSTAGRYHSDWLTMMYPRMKLARNLLTDDGVIFISIDDNEVHNLRKMCDEVFGEGNFVGNIIWKKKTNGNNMGLIPPVHDYIIVYAKDSLQINEKEFGFPLSEEYINKNYSNPDNDPRGPWTTMDLSANHKGPYFEIKNPVTNDIHLPSDGRYWVFNEQEVLRRIAEGRIIFGKSGNSKPVQKVFLKEKEQKRLKAESWWDKYGMNEDATVELKELFGIAKIFDHSKPSSIIAKFITIATDNESIILDFFSGSATTAHAAMQLNAEEGGNRKFIMVQVPEKTDEKSEAYKAGYKNICEIGKERIRRAGKKIAAPSGSPQGGEKESAPNLFDNAGASQPLPLGEVGRGLDTGFRVYRLDTSNMQEVYYRPQDYRQEMMELFAHHIKPDRTADDLVAQVMLDWGLPLSLPVGRTTIAGKTVYQVDGNALYCCFDEGIDEGFVHALLGTGHAETRQATSLPMRIVFYDHSFANDTAKENVRQLLKQLSADTEMKVI